ncbi:MAG: TlpA family protein disulfide reductase [Clostridia bacterium]|nr:TlpA family protein disulfide reductase [Clostridia bacterium]
MKRLISLALVAIIACLSLFSCANEQERRGYEMAPDFRFVNRDGDGLTLKKFRGKPVVLNFWQTTCPPCRAEMPDFENAYLEYGDRIDFIILNVTNGYSQTIEIAYDYIEKMGYTFPVYYDVYGQGAYAYDISTIPATFFIDEEGYLISYARTMLTKDTLQQGIDMILEQ